LHLADIYMISITKMHGPMNIKSVMISKFGVPQSVASIHSLQFLNSRLSYVSIAVIFHGVSSSVIICGNRSFGFASAEESFAIMEMSLGSPASRPASDMLATKKRTAFWYQYPPL